MKAQRLNAVARVIYSDYFDNGGDDVFAKAYANGCKSMEDFGKCLKNYVRECLDDEPSGLGVEYALKYIELANWTALAARVARDAGINVGGEA